MKREDLKAIDGLTDEAIDAIMKLHGKDIETHKSALTAAQTELDTTKTQLGDANKQIASFKGMKTQEEVDAAVGEWKTKYDAAVAEAATSVAKIKQDHALEAALRDEFKVKDMVAVRAHLKLDDVKFNDKDGTFVGLKEQVEPLKESHGVYFSDVDEDTPDIVSGGNSQSVVSSAFSEAMYRGAGIKKG